MKKIVFRVDSGNHIGIGHVMRCLTLAQKLKENHFDIYFLTKNHVGFSEKLFADHFPVKVLDCGVQRPLTLQEKADYKEWLGQSLEDDLKQTNLFIKDIGGVDLLIVDHYSLDENFEESVHAQKVMVIDDLMNRKHSCDLLVDQNITANIESYKLLSKKKETHFLMGPSFALLRPEFLKARNLVKPELFERVVSNILVFFGGADEEGYTLKLAQSLEAKHFKNYHFTFILSTTHKDYSEMQLIQKNNPEVLHLSFAEDFAGLMLSSDLFIGAGGTTSWERACLGVASAVMAVAENQIGNCEYLQKSNIAYYLGPATDMNESKWNIFFEEVVTDKKLWNRYRKNSFDLVDGQGTQRVVDEIKKVLSC